MFSGRKRAKLDEANIKLGEAIAKAQTSLTKECRQILDTTIGVSPQQGHESGPSNLTDGEL